MYIYMCVYVCIYIYNIYDIYVYMYIYNIYVYMYIYMYVYVCMYIYVCMYMCVCVCKYLKNNKQIITIICIVCTNLISLSLNPCSFVEFVFAHYPALAFRPADTDEPN